MRLRHEWPAFIIKFRTCARPTRLPCKPIWVTCSFRPPNELVTVACVYGYGFVSCSLNNISLSFRVITLNFHPREHRYYRAPGFWSRASWITTMSIETCQSRLSRMFIVRWTKNQQSETYIFIVCKTSTKI